MKNKHNKRNLPSLLSICNPGPQVSVQSRDDDVLLHDEAGVTIISYLIQAADDGRQVVRIRIFVLLVLGEAFMCSQLLGAHTLSGCDTVSFPFGKGKISALKILSAGNFPGLFGVLDEEGATQADLMKVGKQFFTALYGHPAGTSIAQACYNMYSGNQGKPLHIMYLPPTDINLYLHV